MALILFNQTAAPITYSSAAITVPASGQVSASSGQATSLASDASLLSDISLGNINIGDSVRIFTSDAATDYLAKFFSPNQFDSDGAVLSRAKQCPTGWTYQMRGFEFQTSTLASLVNQDVYGVALTDISLKFYDAAGADISAQTQAYITANCVRTQVDFEPTYDYYLIGGICKVLTSPNFDCRISVLAVPDLTYAQGGSRTMVQSVNLKFITPGDKVDADGRAAKFLQYSATYHSNKLRFILLHPAGAQCSLGVFVETYKL